MKRRISFQSVGCLAIVLVFLGADAPAAIIVSTALRDVATAATYAAPDSDSSAALGTFSESAASLGTGPGGTIGTTADQSSTTPNTTGASISGSGSAAASVDATGADGYSVLAHSSMDVFFEVDLSGTHTLTGSVNWTGSVPPFGGIAFITLTDTDNSITVATVDADPGDQGTTPISVAPFLTAGITYRLEAVAHIDGGASLPGTFLAAADWDLTLLAPNNAIPEPSALALLMGLVGALHIRARPRAAA